MTTNLTGSDLEGRTVLSSDGEKLGTIHSVLVDDTGAPQYIEVRSGWFGTRHHTVPLTGIDRSGDEIRLPYTREQLRAAPTFEGNEQLDYDRERTLGSHYGTPVRDWDDRRDTWLAEEDLSRGPTPETRHPDGGLDDARDTTQGPTPETRRAMRMTEDDPAAAGQPMADPMTREGGTLDTGTGRDTGMTTGTGGTTGMTGTTGDAGYDTGMTTGTGTGAGEGHRAGRVRVRRWMAGGETTSRGPGGEPMGDEVAREIRERQGSGRMGGDRM